MGVSDAGGDAKGMEAKPLLRRGFRGAEDSLEPGKDTHPSRRIRQGRTNTIPFPFNNINYCRIILV